MKERELYGIGLCQARGLKIDVCHCEWVELGEAEGVSSKVSQNFQTSPLFVHKRTFSLVVDLS